MRKLSKITETYWSGMNKRSQGTRVRKEDDPENFDKEQFFNYLRSRYENVNTPNGEKIFTSESDVISIPILMDKNKYELNGKKYNIVYYLQIWDVDNSKRDMTFHISGKVMRKNNVFSQTLKVNIFLYQNIYIKFKKFVNQHNE